LMSQIQLPRSVPRVVKSNEFGLFSKLRARIFSKLRARIRVYEKKGNLFLGYCKRHKTYFLDFEHTNGDIRCPICDEAWLVKHQLT
jgi:hypothetical protein